VAIGKDPGIPVVKDALAPLVKVGASFTVRVKFWVASGSKPLVAIKTSGYSPPLPAVGVPLRLAVPFRLSVKLIPPGKVPVKLNVGEGYPLLVKANDPGVPTKNVVLFELVIAGPSPMDKVRVWVASGFTPFDPVRETAYIPPSPATGVPLRVAVPSPLSIRVRLAGRAGLLEKVTAEVG